MVAVDGSKYSRWALNWLTSIPFATPADVTAVHAIDMAALQAPFVIQTPWMNNIRFLRVEAQRLSERGQAIQQDAAERLAAVNLRGRAMVSHGPIVPTILRFAKPHGLVIVGHRGLDAVERVMLGSTSARLVRESRCSVLVVKDRPRVLRRIVLAIDGSGPSRKGLHFLTTAVDPAARRDIELVVCHVMPYLRYPEVKAAGERLVSSAADKLVRAGYQVIEAARLGPVADEIIKVASHHRADLIIVGARGRGPVSRFFLGSVSTRLLDHADSSILIAR